MVQSSETSRPAFRQTAIPAGKKSRIAVARPGEKRPLIRTKGRMWKNNALININEANVSGANGRTGANFITASWVSAFSRRVERLDGVMQFHRKRRGGIRIGDDFDVDARV